MKKQIKQKLLKKDQNLQRAMLLNKKIFKNISFLIFVDIWKFFKIYL